MILNLQTLTLAVKIVLFRLAEESSRDDDSRLLILTELRTPVTCMEDIDLIDLRTQSCGMFVERVNNEYRRIEKEEV